MRNGCAQGSHIGYASYTDRTIEVSFQTFIYNSMVQTQIQIEMKTLCMQDLVFMGPFTLELSQNTLRAHENGSKWIHFGAISI